MSEPTDDLPASPRPALRFSSRGKARLSLNGRSFTLVRTLDGIRFEGVDPEAERAAAALTGRRILVAEFDECLRELQAQGEDVGQLVATMWRPKAGEKIASIEHPLALFLASASPDYQIRMAAADNLRTPRPTLKALTNDHYAGPIAAGNPSLGDSKRESWLNSASQWERASFAAVATLTPELIRRLLADHPDVRAQLARNPNLPQAELERLAEDEAREVRAKAAGNPRLPARLLERLAQSGDRWVAGQVAGNPSAPPELIHELALAGFAREALDNPSRPSSTPSELAGSADWETRRRAAADSKIAPGRVADLAQDRDPRVRAAVAARTDLEPNTLALLAKDRDPRVLLALAGNPALSPAHMFLMTQVVYAWEAWCRLAIRADCPAEVLAEIAREGDTDCRMAVAAHPSASLALLSEIADSTWSQAVHVAREEMAARATGAAHSRRSEIALEQLHRRFGIAPGRPAGLGLE